MLSERFGAVVTLFCLRRLLAFHRTVCRIFHPCSFVSHFHVPHLHSPQSQHTKRNSAMETGWLPQKTRKTTPELERRWVQKPVGAGHHQLERLPMKTETSVWLFYWLACYNVRHYSTTTASVVYRRTRRQRQKKTRSVLYLLRNKKSPCDVWMKKLCSRSSVRAKKVARCQSCECRRQSARVCSAIKANRVSAARQVRIGDDESGQQFVYILPIRRKASSPHCRTNVTGDNLVVRLCNAVTHRTCWAARQYGTSRWSWRRGGAGAERRVLLVESWSEVEFLFYFFSFFFINFQFWSND